MEIERVMQAHFTLALRKEREHQIFPTLGFSFDHLEFQVVINIFTVLGSIARYDRF